MLILFLLLDFLFITSAFVIATTTIRTSTSTTKTNKKWRYPPPPPTTSTTFGDNDVVLVDHQQRRFVLKPIILASSSSSREEEEDRGAVATTTTDASPARQQRQYHHCVDGIIDCVEVRLELPVIGNVSILEATADAQESLVNLALLLEEDEDEYNDDDVNNIGSGLTLSSGDPYGAVLWPAAYAVASHLLSNTDKLLKNKTVLEIGTGTGLVSLAALKGGAKTVIATDYEQIPLRLLQYAATNLNNNNISDDDEEGSSSSSSQLLQTQLFDICDFEQSLPSDNNIDIVVAADIMYEPRTGRAMADRVVEALHNGCHVLIGDSPGRAGRPAFLKRLHELGISPSQAKFVDKPGWTVTGERNELICGKESQTVSRKSIFPQELTIAIMELDPTTVIQQQQQ